MSLAKIKTKTAALKSLALSAMNPEDNTSLREQIIFEYHKQVILKLETLFAKNHQNTEDYVNDFQSFLEQNWNLVKGSLLAYTTLAKADITLILCEIANYVSENSPANKKLLAIEALMPGIAYESQSDAYPDLNTLPLQRIIATYILSDSKDYLIPVALLAKVEQQNISRDLTQEFHPYYDVDAHGNCYNLTSVEADRLCSHSDYTRAVSDTLKEYQQLLCHDQDSLLGRLNKLIQALTYNSVKGIGREEYAGEGGYLAIVSFMEYYARLDTKDIPEPIKQEIELIRTLGSDNSQLGAIESCFATRSQALKTTVSGNESTLSTITLSASNKKSAITDILSHYQRAKQQLNDRLEKNDYAGQDKTGITTRIFQDLGIKFKLKDYSELLAAIKGLTREEAEAVTHLEGAPQQIINAIASVENLVLLFTKLNQDIMTVLLQSIEHNLQCLIKDRRDFLATLISLTTDQCSLVCQTFKQQLPAIIKSSFDFGNVLEYLTSDQRMAVYEALKERLPEIIKNHTDFRMVLEYLTSDQRTAVCEALKDKLPAIIKNSTDFRMVLEYLTSDQRTAVFEALKDKLPKLIKNSTDFWKILKFLTLDQRTAVFEALKDKLPELIKNHDDWGDVLAYLTSDQRTAVCEALKNKLPELVKSSTDFRIVFLLLQQEQRTVVYEVLKDKLPDMIKNSTGLRMVLEGLTPDQRTAVYEALKDKLPELIKNSTDFGNVIKFLTPDQRIVVCEALKDKLPELVKNYTESTTGNREPTRSNHSANFFQLPTSYDSDFDVNALSRSPSP